LHILPGFYPENFCFTFPNNSKPKSSFHFYENISGLNKLLLQILKYTGCKFSSKLLAAVSVWQEKRKGR